jgi:pimeloyl-ACP methyl ester carboxylesterase
MEILPQQPLATTASIEAQNSSLEEIETDDTATIIKSTVSIENYGVANMITYKPAGAAGKKLPVIVFTPGNGEVGTDANKLYTHGPLRFIRNGWRPTDFILVGIQPRIGCGSASPRFAHAMLTEIRKNPLIDTNRVYMTGLSGGAFTALRYIRDYPTPYKIAAVMAFSIDMPISITKDVRFANVPAWAMCGNTDYREPSMRTYFNTLKSKSYDAKYTQYIGGHGSWNTYYNPTWTKDGYSVYSWLLQWEGASSMATAIAPTNTYKYIPVKITNPTHLSTSWNNLVDSTGNLKFTDNTLSGIKAKLSSKKAISDNGSSYGNGMAPAEILRFTSYHTSARTLTVTGLNTGKTYNLELYASRNRNANEQTIFTLGTTKSVSTYNNKMEKVVFENIKPDSDGKIIVGLKSAVTYNYLNGFTLTEITK